jgi:hypothetical protein
MMEWQPIETAPDGCVLVAFVDQFSGQVQLAVAERAFGGGEWVTNLTDSNDGTICVYPTPTHWMPLPEPPNA